VGEGRVRGGREERCAVGIFNYFRLWKEDKTWHCTSLYMTFIKLNGKTNLKKHFYTSF